MINWEETENIADIINTDHLLIVYGTNLLADKLSLSEILTSEEFAFSERLKGSGQKDTWLSCRATLRLLLASYINKKPNEIEFRKGKFGKLSVVGMNSGFNVSHASHSFLIGLNPSGRIGVDIEKLTGSEDLPLMIDYAFSASEANYCKIGKLADRFTEVWTLKEAFLKAAGVGLVDELRSFSVIGPQENEIDQYKLNKNTFLCPDGETGSIVFRNNCPLKYVCIF